MRVENKVEIIDLKSMINIERALSQTRVIVSQCKTSYLLHGA